MTLAQLCDRTRQLLRDTNKTIFRQIEIENGINEAIDRVKTIPALLGMKNLEGQDQEVELMPKHYHYLLPLFSASRCLTTDEQDARAGVLMNEFENKLFEFRTAIENGEITIVDSEGNKVDTMGDLAIDYVKDEYFKYVTKGSEVVKTEEDEEEMPQM